jgi:hypothetical protein
LDNYGNWFNSVFGSGVSDTLGGVIYTGLTNAGVSNNRIAAITPAEAALGSAVVAVPVGIGLVAGGEVVLGVGTLGAAGGKLVVTAGTVMAHPMTVPTVYGLAEAAAGIDTPGGLDDLARFGAKTVCSRAAGRCAAPVSAASLPWARAGAARAARAIEAGQTSIKVASRDDAAELVWRMFSSRGFLNTTGRTGSDVRKIVGSKAGTYHWDDVLDAAGNVAGHGANNVHAGMRHVQIHLESGDIVRIFFP